MFSPALKKSLATAAATTAALSYPTAVAHAEEKKTKLSIYDEPQPQVVVIEAPTKLEEQVAQAQKYANERLVEGQTAASKLVAELKAFESDVKASVKQTIAEDEDVLPNALYVGVAALAGTILARNRNIVVRFVTSTALAVGTAHYLLPKTTHNVCVQLEKLERKYPELQAAHASVNQAVMEARKEVDNALTQLRGTVGQSTDKLFGSETKDKFENVKKSVESMYSTRSNPGVEETLKKN